jgi:hypothetical protein
MNNLIKISAFVTLLLVTIVPALAQGPGAPPATPIDGGLSLLLAAGGIYGLKKLNEKRKN